MNRNTKQTRISSGSSPRSILGHPCARGFTIIELVVVVAIISLLAAMLLPALRSTRERSKAAACVNNLRQLGVAIRTWTADHDGNFVGIGENGWWAGGQGLTWYSRLGREGYIGGQVSFTKKHVNVGYGGLTQNWRWPILQCPGEPVWTTMTNGGAPDPSYSGVPYNNYLNEYITTSYDPAFQVGNIVHCKCSREGNGFWCSTTYCPNADDTCCAVGYSTPTIAGVTPARALIVMDNKIYNSIGWHMNCFYGTELGISGGTAISIVDNPVYMHAFRHPGKTANGLFLDGHVEAIRPAELTPPDKWPKYRIWHSDTGFLAEW